MSRFIPTIFMHFLKNLPECLCIFFLKAGDWHSYLKVNKINIRASISCFSFLLWNVCPLKCTLALNIHKRIFVFCSFISVKGFTGGSYYGHKGAAVEPLCLPRNPEWEIYNDGYDGAKAYIYGAEYETNTFKGSIKTLHDHDIPCAVCLVRQRSIVQMFPGKYELKQIGL